MHKTYSTEPTIFKKEHSTYYMSNLPDIQNKTLAARIKNSTKLNYDQVVYSPAEPTSFCIQNHEGKYCFN
jgi:hypothetical protein